MGLFTFLSCISPRTKRSNKEKRRAKVYLNVYDVTPVNNYLYWFGLGIHHSGIEVHGVEYAFGGYLDPTCGEDPTSGVYEVKPRRCPGYVFRRSTLLGSTDMSSSEISSFMKHLSKHYHGNTYDLFSKNCNHFTDEVSQRLTGKPIPGWVNRLARVGCFIESLLPESNQSTSVKRHHENQMYSEDRDDSGASSVTGDSDAEEVDPLLRK